MGKNLTYLSYLVFILAILAWGAVVYGGMWIQGEARARGANAMSAEERAEQATYATRLRTIAADTILEREQLENISRIDIVSIADAIESAGDSAGVDAKVSTAIPVGVPEALPGGTPVQGLAFIVEAEGSFSGLVQFVRIMERFPAFSSVEQFELGRVVTTDNRGAAWRASIRIQIMSTSDISS